MMTVSDAVEQQLLNDIKEFASLLSLGDMSLRHSVADEDEVSRFDTVDEKFVVAIIRCVSESDAFSDIDDRR